MAHEWGWRQGGFLRTRFDWLPGGIEDLSDSFTNSGTVSAEQQEGVIHRALSINRCPEGSRGEREPNVWSRSGSSLEDPFERDGAIVFAAYFW